MNKCNGNCLVPFYIAYSCSVNKVTCNMVLIATCFISMLAHSCWVNKVTCRVNVPNLAQAANWRSLVKMSL
jgi:hypothetical protein